MLQNRILISGIFLLALFNSAYAKTGNSLNYHPKNYKNRARIAKLNLIQQNRKENYAKLQRMKLNILAGDLEQALQLSYRINDKNSQIKYIKYRYQALIYFLLGKYALSLQLLQKKGMQNHQHYPDICTLKVLNLLALNKNEKIKGENKKCTKSTISFSKNGQLWMNAILDVKFSQTKNAAKHLIDGAAYLHQDNDIIKIWLKSATYLKQEKVIEKYIDFLSLDALKSKKIRELIGLIYYRLGKSQLSLTYIEDLDSPNAENIKGNILLAEKKYELAYGHFSLALKKKKNSINALERILPLAWNLELWDQGINHLYHFIDKKTNPTKMLALHVAFNIRKKDFKRASKQLRQLNKLLQYQTPLNVDVLNSYNALIEGNNKEFAYYLTRACNRHEAMNCWLLMQTLVWDDLPKTLKRSDRLLSGDTALKFSELRKSYQGGAIDEEKLIDQKEIEELDEGLISVRIFE